MRVSRELVLPCGACYRKPTRDTHTQFDLENDTLYFYAIRCPECRGNGVLSLKSRARVIATWNFQQLKIMSEFTDSDLRQFVLDLDESDQELTEWEEGFVQTIIDSNVTSFTPRQREVLRQMIAKYDNEIL